MNVGDFRKPSSRPLKGKFWLSPDMDLLRGRVKWHRWRKWRIRTLRRKYEEILG